MKDHELEKLMRQIAEDASLDDARVDEIADSPTLWWNVQREVRNATPAPAPWPPSYLRRGLAIGVPVAAVAMIGLALYLGSAKTSAPAVARDSAPVLQTSDNRPSPQPIAGPIQTPQTPDQSLVAEKKPAVSRLQPVRAASKSRVTIPRTQMARNNSKPATEIKSDFIALAYARNPESGQLVRVKVPSSMMVTLGLVSTVDKPSQLVDAEVLVGDDGLTQAIRFIRQ